VSILSYSARNINAAVGQLGSACGSNAEMATHLGDTHIARFLDA